MAFSDGGEILTRAPSSTLGAASDPDFAISTATSSTSSKAAQKPRVRPTPSPGRGRRRDHDLDRHPRRFLRQLRYGRRLQLFMPVHSSALENPEDYGENGIMIGNGLYMMDAPGPTRRSIPVKNDNWTGDFNGETGQPARQDHLPGVRRSGDRGWLPRPARSTGQHPAGPGDRGRRTTARRSMSTSPASTT